MKINIFLINLITIFLYISNSFSYDVIIESSSLDLKNDGNKIITNNAKIDIPEKNIKIKSGKVNYDKGKNYIIFEDNVLFQDLSTDTTIKGNKINYDLKNDLIYSEGKTKLFLKKDYTIESKNIYFERSSNKIYSVEDTIIEDKERNIIKLKEDFLFDIKNNIIKSKKTLILDKNDNKYIFEDLILNLNNNEIAGKEIKIEFEKSYFGNSDNEPLLKGRSIYSNDNELNVYKAVFSTCNIINKNCRGWEVNTNKFTHDKKGKLFEYKDTWLKIFDYKVFYLPYFNHPDPTVKRKSGFLTPSYNSSKSLGNSINIPYFKIIDFDKDITFNPRYYVDKSFLLQNEYRQALKNSNVISDFSFLVGKAGTKGHLYYNQIGSFDENKNYEINLQNIKGDNYFKNHNLKKTSSLINDDNILTSNFDFNIDFSDSRLNTSFKVIEDLSRNNHDRYQYIFPDFDYKKYIEIPESYNGKFIFDTFGYNKNYDTNITEAVVTNDFLFKSNDYINDIGILTNYNILLKNTNSYSTNSNNFEENSNYDLYGTVKVDTSLPLQKKTAKFTNYLKPILSLRYSPNGNSNLSAKDILLNYNSVFDLNRIGNVHEVEGGTSASVGLEFNRDENYSSKSIDFKIANVLKLEENNNLPFKSKLNKTRSDVFGNLNYNLSDKTNLGYFFSYDRDLKYSNMEELNIEFGLENFMTNFSYYSEDNDIGNKENLKNKSEFNIDNENKLSFEITKNLKEDFTQYYDLIYTYQTDCLSIDLNYNKSFYRDGNLEPNQSLSFLIKIIPFTELGVQNISNFNKN